MAGAKICGWLSLFLWEWRFTRALPTRHEGRAHLPDRQNTINWVYSQPHLHFNSVYQIEMETRFFHQSIQSNFLIPGQQNKHTLGALGFSWLWPSRYCTDSSSNIFHTSLSQQKPLPALSEYRHSWERALSRFSQGNTDSNRWAAPGF